MATVRPSGRGFNPIENDFFAREAELYETSGPPGDDCEAAEWDGEGHQSRRLGRRLAGGTFAAMAVVAIVGLVRFQPRILEVASLSMLWHEARGDRPGIATSVAVPSLQAASVAQSLPPVKSVEPRADIPKETPAAPAERIHEAAPASDGPVPTSHRRPSQSAGKFAGALSKCKAESSADHVRRALDACRVAVALQPRSAEALTLLAHAEVQRHHSREAQRLATAAISSDPRFTDAYAVMGKAHQQEGQKARARASYRQYLALAPNGRYAKEVRKNLQRL